MGRVCKGKVQAGVFNPNKNFALKNYKKLIQRKKTIKFQRTYNNNYNKNK